MHESSLTSPEQLRLCVTASVARGLAEGIEGHQDPPHCLNLLLVYADGCSGSCSYCNYPGVVDDKVMFGAAGEGPVLGLGEIIARAQKNLDIVQRICVSLVMNPRAVSDAAFLAEEFSRELPLPVSVLVEPTAVTEGDLERLSQYGVDTVVIALDVATRELLDKHRGHGVGGPLGWDACWQTFSDAAIVFGKDNFACQLIVGMGETEQEMVETIEKVRSLGGHSHIFAFSPEPETILQDARPCPAGSFRRIQLARYLIDYESADISGMEFDSMGRIASFGLEGNCLDNLVKSGRPFLASGCPGKMHDCSCNRPYGSCPPGEISSYPRDLKADEIQLVQKQLATYVNIESQDKTHLPQP